MKKIISITLVLLSLIGLFSACNVKEPEQVESSKIDKTDESDNGIKDDIGDKETDTKEPVQSDFYQMIEVNERDVKSSSGKSFYAVHIESYGELNKYIENSAISSIDKSIFDGNSVYFVNSGYEKVMGFKDLVPTSNECALSAHMLRYDSESYENNYYIVLVPQSELVFNYAKANPSLSIVYEPEYIYIKRKAENVPLENQSPVAFCDKTDLKAYLDDMGVNSYSQILQDKSMYVVIYEKTEYTNKIYSVFKNAKISKDGKLEITLDTYYENQKGYEYNSNCFYIVRVPLSREIQIENINIVENEKILSKSQTTNSAYDNYLALWNIEYTENEYDLDSGYEIVTTVDEYIEATGKELGSYYQTLYEEFFESNIMIIIKTKEENSKKEVTGICDLEISDGVISLTVIEHKASFIREGVLTRLVYVPISLDDIVNCDISSITIDVKTGNIDYYNQIGTASQMAGNYPNYTSKTEDLYIISDYYDFVSEWSEFTSENIINSISQKDFENNILLAIYRIKGSSANYDIGYHRFYIDSEGMHITLDEGVEYIGDTAIYEWYDLVLIPKEIFQGGDIANEGRIDINHNEIERESMYIYGW